MMPRRYSELTRENIWALRLLAAIEVAYPEAGDKNTRIIAGYDEWRQKTPRVERD